MTTAFTKLSTCTDDLFEPRPAGKFGKRLHTTDTLFSKYSPDQRLHAAADKPIRKRATVADRLTLVGDDLFTLG
jgi:hypothetical protein